MDSLSARIANLSPERRALFEKHLASSGVEFSVDTISRRGMREGIPLSFAQQRLWFLDRLAPGKAFYNEPVLALQLTGTLSLDLLRKTFKEIACRHEILRSVFPNVGGNPMMFVTKHWEPTIAYQDLSRESKIDRERIAQKTIWEEGHRHFDLANGPLFYVSILRLARDSHLLLVATHHIIFDGWSLRVLLDEMAALYRFLSQKKQCELPPLQVQYADYALWQRDRLKGDFLKGLLEFWTSYLGSKEIGVALPNDRIRDTLPSYQGATETVDLSPLLVHKLREIAAKGSFTLFMIFLTAFKVLISSSTGETTITIGVPVAGRTRPEMEKLIGFFVNTLVVRTNIRGSTTFLEALQQVRGTALDALNHQELPFGLLVQKLCPERDHFGSQPLFRAMYVHHNYVRRHHHLGNLAAERIEVAADQAKFDLVLVTDESSSDNVQLKLEYAVDLFNGTTISKMLRSLLRLLDLVAANLAVRLDELKASYDSDTTVIHP